MKPDIPARKAEAKRKTAETDINLVLNLDGSGEADIHTGFGLLDHMLALLAFWGDMDLQVECRGDMHVDAHHTVEDTGLVAGGAILEALGDRRGICRAGYGRVPMDEALAEVTIDLSGRPWLEWRGDDLLPPILGGEEKDLWREFFKALASSGKFNLHVSFLYGKNGHHLLESAFKGLGMALKGAIWVESSKIKSTKGELD